MARQKISLKIMFFGYMEILSVWVSEEDLERALMFKYPKKTKIHASPPQKLATLIICLICIFSWRSNWFTIFQFLSRLHIKFKVCGGFKYQDNCWSKVKCSHSFTTHKGYSIRFITNIITLIKWSFWISPWTICLQILSNYMEMVKFKMEKSHWHHPCIFYKC